MKDTNRPYFVGIDAGGTKILTVLMDYKFRIRAEAKFKVESEKGSSFFFKTITKGIERVLNERDKQSGDLAAIGVGCAGMVRIPGGVIRHSPNIPCLKDYALESKLNRYFKVPSIVDNDVNAGLYGEHQFGSAKKFKHVVGIFLGTGVGGAIIINKKLYHGATGSAGEVGHVFMTLDSLMNGGTKLGTVEAMAGRMAIASEAALLAARQKSPHLYNEVGVDIRKMKSKTLARAIRSGDVALKELIEHKARIVGLAMASFVNILNPELIVLGGGVVEAMGDLIIPVARKTMQRYAMPPIVEKVKVYPAELKDYAAAMGAAKLASDRLND